VYLDRIKASAVTAALFPFIIGPQQAEQGEPELQGQILVSVLKKMAMSVVTAIVHYRVAGQQSPHES